jgi:hypothetical protein
MDVTTTSTLRQLAVHRSTSRREAIQRAQDCVEPLQKYLARLPAPTRHINLVCHEIRRRPPVFGLALSPAERVFDGKPRLRSTTFCS